MMRILKTLWFIFLKILIDKFKKDKKENSMNIKQAKDSISVVIFTYKRPKYFRQQLIAIKNQTIKPIEIIVGHLINEKTKYFDFYGVDKIIDFKYDPGIFSKFITATAAKGDFIAIFDDDIIPGNRWFENCLDCFKKEKGLYGSFGGKLTESSYQKVKKFGGLHRKSQHKELVDFIGMSWFFPFEYLSYIWKEKPPFYENGEDIFFSFMLKKYKKVDSFVTPYPKNRDFWGSIYPEYGIDENAIFLRDMKTHKSIRNETVKILMERGWKSIMMGKNGNI